MTTHESMVHIVDDDSSVRDALSNLIRSHGLHATTFASAHAFLKYERPDIPSCLVLDVHLPDLNGLDLPHELAVDASLPVIFITGDGTIPMSVRAMKEGAVEFLTKPVPESELMSAIKLAIERDAATRQQRIDLATVQERLARLTPREQDVLALVVKGHANKQIASELGAAEPTIKIHRGRIMRKLQVGSVAELVRFVGKVKGV